MRTSGIWFTIAAGVTACAMPLLAGAQSPQQPPQTPPQMEKLEEGEAPAITIRKPDTQRKITETRAKGGKVTEVQVQSGKNTYYLKPNDQAGSALPGDAESNASRPAQWQVMEFDTSRAKEAQQKGAVQTPPPPQPANPPAPAKK
jgi:hypothetical protein